MTKLCQTCDQPISDKRIAVLPSATQCILCKNKEDDPVARVPAYSSARLGRIGLSYGDSHMFSQRKLRLHTFGLSGAI